MFYKLLGMVVWNGAKIFLRRKYGSTYAPKPLLAGGILAIVAAVALVAARGVKSELPAHPPESRGPLRRDLCGASFPLLRRPAGLQAGRCDRGHGEQQAPPSRRRCGLARA